MKNKLTISIVMLISLVLYFFGSGTAHGTETVEPTETTSTTVATPWVQPSTHCPDPEKPYPQSYALDAPCGAVDPCVVHDPVTGAGSTLWLIMKCSVPVDEAVTEVTTSEPPAVTAPPTLPQTGGETLGIAAIGALFVLLGYAMYRATKSY